MRTTYRWAVTAALVICCACALTVRAQDTNAPVKSKEKPAAKAKEAKPAKEKTTTFSGKLGAIDKVMKTITLDDKKKTVIEVTSDSLVTKDGKPAIMTDGTIGEPVNGTAKTLADGKMSALLLNYGKKVTPPKKATKPKKEAKPVETNAAPTVAPTAAPTAPPTMPSPPVSAPMLTPPSTNTP